jgi:hypothetical protein
VPLPQPGQVYQPFQYAFIVQPQQSRLPATLLASWDLEVEFLDQDSQASATPHTAVLDWQQPQFHLLPRAGAGAVSALAGRPGAVDYQPTRPYRIVVNFT